MCSSSRTGWPAACPEKSSGGSRRRATDQCATMRMADPELLAEDYAEHVGKPFYLPLVEFMLSGPVVALVAEGHRVIEGFRLLAGATDPTSAAPGTIRGDLARDWGLRVQQNLVHGSDSAESAAREVALWFPES